MMLSIIACKQGEQGDIGPAGTAGTKGAKGAKRREASCATRVCAQRPCTWRLGEAMTPALF